MKGPIFSVIVTWVVVIGIAWSRMVDVGHAIVIGAIVTALILVPKHSLSDTPRMRRLPSHSHAGSRQDVTHLSWGAVDIDGRVTPPVVTRVKALAEAYPESLTAKQTASLERPMSPYAMAALLKTCEERIAND